MDTRANWAGNCVYRASRWCEAEDEEEVVAAVLGADRLRVVGTGHSFNDIADTDGSMLSLGRMNRVLALDDERRIVIVEPGITYGALGRFLHARGWAVANTGSLPHIAVAGACAVGTHGSGNRNGNVATAVRSLRFVLASGAVLEVSRDTDGDRFPGMVIHLGALGVVVRIELDIVPDFQVAQTVYQDLPLATAQERFEEVMAAGYSVSLFTDWRAPRFNQVWVKRRVGDPDIAADLLGAPAACALHPIAGMPAEHCTDQLGVPGPCHERLPHFRMDFVPSAGDELQTEYLLARADAPAALDAFMRLAHLIAPVCHVSEVRTVAADDLWLSPSYRRDSVALHVTWRSDWPRVRAVLPEIDRALAPFAARPHWSKLFTTPAATLASLYPRLAEFRALARALDPSAKFMNPYLARHLFP